MAKVKEKILEPIPKNEQEEWRKLIEDTIKVVNRADKAQFDLILLAGKVETKYGENRVKRWADETGISFAAARQYRWMASKGVNQAFITKWARTDKKLDGLSYSVIREILQFTGSAKSPYTLEYLQWAVDHKASVIGVRAYMYEINAPHNSREEAAKEIKASLADKQSHEGFNDYIRHALEQIVEEHPEAEDAVLQTAITSVEDLNALKIAAGIVTDEETKIIGEARNHIRKLKTYHSWFRTHGKELTDSIAYGHEAANELKLWIDTLLTDLTALAETEVGTFDSTAVEAPEVTLRSTSTS